MSQGLVQPEARDLVAELERELLPRLLDLLRSRGPGHCMRISDLDQDLMVRLCRRLGAEEKEAQVVILGDEASRTPAELTVTSTKLVELRNPLPDATLRPPLLVFLPSGLRAAAEDSFGVATFEEVDIGDVYRGLRDRLVRELPEGVRGAVAEGLRRLEGGEGPWPFADAVSVVRFLLTAKVNDFDADAIGAALYELALVPDFELLTDPTRAPARIARNRDCVARLTWSPKSERGRVLDLGLSSRVFRAQLGGFLAETGVEDPRTWTRRIVLDRSSWPLAFHRWEFEDGGEEPESIFIGDVTTDLPVVGEDTEDERLEPLIGQQVLVLGRGGARKLNVTFRVDPHPAKVTGLARLVAQVVSTKHGPIGLARGKKAWKTRRQETKVMFSRLDKVDWEEGWHFIRVLAQSADSDLVALVDERGRLLPWSAEESDAGGRPNESDLFYVIGEVEEPPELPQRAVPRDDSLEHARWRLRFSAVVDGRDPEGISPTSVRWAERHPRGRPVGSEMLEVKLGREGTVHVPVSRPLRELETTILESPDGPLSWRLTIKLGEAGKATGRAARWPEGESSEVFLETSC